MFAFGFLETFKGYFLAFLHEKVAFSAFPANVIFMESQGLGAMVADVAPVAPVAMAPLDVAPVARGSCRIHNSP